MPGKTSQKDTPGKRLSHLTRKQRDDKYDLNQMTYRARNTKQHEKWENKLYLISPTCNLQEAQLSPRDRATCCVSWNHAKCRINVCWIAFDKSCNRRMTFKVIEDHWKWHKSIAIWYFLLVTHYNNLSNVYLANFFDIITFTVYVSACRGPNLEKSFVFRDYPGEPIPER